MVLGVVPLNGCKGLQNLLGPLMGKVAGAFKGVGQSANLTSGTTLGPSYSIGSGRIDPKTGTAATRIINGTPTSVLVKDGVIYNKSGQQLKPKARSYQAGDTFGQGTNRGKMVLPRERS